MKVTPVCLVPDGCDIADDGVYSDVNISENIRHLDNLARPCLSHVVSCLEYCETYNISYTFVGNKVVDHSDVAGASRVGAAPTTSSFSN